MGSCLLLFSITFYLLTYHFSGFPLEKVTGDVGPRFFPRLFLAALAFESICLILSSAKSLQKLSNVQELQIKHFHGLPFIMLAAFMLYIGLTFLAGYILATIAFMILSIYLLGVRNVWQLVIIPPGIALATYFLFQVILDVYLPMGSIF